MLYGPNDDAPEFFEIISKHIETLGNESAVVGGDFNVPLDYSRDTKLYRRKNNQKAIERVLQMISEHDLVDVWRERNPSVSRFTWHGPEKIRSMKNCCMAGLLEILQYLVRSL